MSEILTKLKESVRASLDKAEDKTHIETATTLNTQLDEADKEIDKLEAKYKELLTSYKEVVAHTSFKDDKSPEPAVPGAAEAPNLESMLLEFGNNLKKEGK